MATYIIPAFIRFSALFLELIVMIVLSRVLSKQEMGYYQNAYSFMQIALVLAASGCPLWSTKYYARYTLVCKLEILYAYTKYAIGRIMFNSAWVVITTIAYTLILHIANKSEYVYTVWVAALSVMPLAYVRLLSGAYNGKGWVAFSQLPEYVLRPVIYICCVLLTINVLKLNSHFLDANLSMLLFLIANVATLSILGLVSVRLFAASNVKPITAIVTRNVAEEVEWRNSSRYMTMTGILQAVGAQIDSLILVLFVPSFVVAEYRVAYMVMAALGMALTVVNVTYANKFSRLYAQYKYKEIGRLAIHNARVAFLGVAIPYGVFMSMDGYLIESVFGEGYKESANILFVLMLGMIVSAATGSVGTILNMIGHEKVVVWGNIVYLGFVSLMCIVLTPMFGVYGSAISAAAGLAIKNIYLTLILYRKHKVRSFLI